jgi:serine O-acetyltransferase
MHPLYLVAAMALCHYKYKFGISLSHGTSIGSGLYIGHTTGIVVNDFAVIGKNCNLSQGVTIGQTNRGKRKGTPVIGDNVYIGPGAKVIGGIRVGNNVAIGANCVVLEDIPDNAVVVGVPGRIVSYNGSQDYVNKTDYDAAALGISATSSTPFSRAEFLAAVLLPLLERMR